MPGASTEGSPRQPSAANPADARGRTAARDRAEAPQAIRTTAASVNIEPAGKVAPVVVDAQPAAQTRAKADGPTGETGVRAQTGRDPKVYLPPRAPDDPGLEHADDVGQPRPDVTRGATSSKRSF